MVGMLNYIWMVSEWLMFHIARRVGSESRNALTTYVKLLACKKVCSTLSNLL